MAWIYADRVLDRSVSTGTGSMVVSGTSPLSWRTFSTVCAVNDTFYYTIVDPITGAWETGEGTYSALNTVARTTFRASSTGSAVSFAANSKDVFLDVTARWFSDGPFLPLTGGTLTGNLIGTAAAFSSTVSTNNGRFQRTGADDIVALFAGATKAARIVTNASGTSIEGVDNTGVGSFQPLVLNGSAVSIAPATTFSSAVTGTTATFSGNVAGASATFTDSSGNTQILQVIGTGANGSGIKLMGNNVGSAPAKWLRSINGQFDIINNAYSAPLFIVTDAGLGTIGASPAAASNNTEIATTAWVRTNAAGSVLQTVTTQTGAMSTGATIMPYDDTIPQITEGNEYMTLAITPKSATSKLVITVTAHLASSVAGNSMTGALFQGATASALAASFVNLQASAANIPATIIFTHTMTSGTTSATTFRFRAGGSVAGTTTFNGANSARLLGGVTASSIVIQEV